MDDTRVILVGAHGYGRNHMRNLARLTADRPIELVGICDVREPGDELTELFGDQAAKIPVTASLSGLLDQTEPDLVIVSTPIHTHADLAIQALDAGCHVLLEKPPTSTMADFERVLAAAQAAGRACQVGFQDLASSALPAIQAMIEAGTIGEPRGVAMAGTWIRDSSYYERAAWAGRRHLDGRAVVDGALTNPFAHGVAGALRLAGVEHGTEIQQLETELYHAHEIEADDTACIRLTTTSGRTVSTAVTLCAEESADPYLLVHGTDGAITLWYKTHELEVRSGGTTKRRTYDRVDLLENLLDHIADPAVELIVPLERTHAFMAVVEAIRTGPDPAPIGIEHQDVTSADGHTKRVVRGVDEAVREATRQLALFSELELPWARRPVRDLTTLSVGDTTVARYLDGADLEPTLAPRPHLHPVRTLAGTVVTDREPEDHRWHLGVGVAVQDVHGCNLWGGRTYVRDTGYTWRRDHGTIRHQRWYDRAVDGFDEGLGWYGPDDQLLVTESRQVRAVGGTAGWWALDFTFTLHNPSSTAVLLGSPGTHGRPGGGYGGFFWRLAPVHDPRVYSPDASGEDEVHGRPAPWLAVNATAADTGRPFTLVFVAMDETTRADPWFVRVAGYPGVGSALAYTDPLTIGAGAATTRRFRVYVADGAWDQERTSSIVEGSRVEASRE